MYVVSGVLKRSKESSSIFSLAGDFAYLRFERALKHCNLNKFVFLKGNCLGWWLFADQNKRSSTSEERLYSTFG